MEKHVTVVAALQIGFSILGIFLALVIFAGMGFVAEFVDDPTVLRLLPFIGGIIGCLLLFLSTLGIIGGIGLLKRKNWARILILIISVFDLMNVPIGTAIAIYTFWVLVQDETARLFTGKPAV